MPAGHLLSIEKRLASLSDALDKKTDKYLSAFKKREEKLYRKLARKDSTKAAQLLQQSKEKYARLEQTLKGEQKFNKYLPFLDTLKTSLQFLEQNKELIQKTKGGSEQLARTLGKVEGLEASLSKGEVIQQFLGERQKQLKEQLSGLPFSKDLKKLHKQAYYYKVQVEEYKAALKDPKKLERKALQLLAQNKAFQSFMRKNSQLASMFRLPSIGDPLDPAPSLQGLQTTSQVTSLIQSRFGSDPAATQQIRDNMQGAQAQLSALKSKAQSLQSGSFGNSSGDLEQPDFKPNGQKTKSFLKRIELGTNVQSQRAQWSFPVTTDFGLSLGYKFNDKSILGVGGSYKVGWGRGWQQLKVTHQGVGIRSFIDYQIKGGFYLSGGYEQNFRSEIKAIEELKDQSAWQSSGLLGVNKKYKVSRKVKGQMQLLWDFLSYQQVPRTQAVLFRIGYNLK